MLWKLPDLHDAALPSGVGNLRPEACDAPHGICAWSAIEIFKHGDTRGTWTQDECFPISAEVAVHFKRGAQPGTPTLWKAEDFAYYISARFTAPTGANDKPATLKVCTL